MISEHDNTISSLPRSAPEAVGIDPEGIQKFIEEVNEKVGGLHGFMLLRHGSVAAEGWWTPFAPQYPHMLYSLSKSFASTAVGLAIEEGHFTLDSLVTAFFPEDLPAHIDANLAAMQVRHLLSMSTGHDTDATGNMHDDKDGNWVRGVLARPVELAPGSKFVYNSAATYLCSAIVQKTVGMTILDYLEPRLLAPLGIEGATWENCPRGINTGGWGLSIKTEDIARFGQLYLQKGIWNGQQLVPAAWIAQATSAQISNGDPAQTSDWSQGYGFQFWRGQHGSYRGDGAFGQYCVVIQEQDAVLAIQSGVSSMQAVLDAAWTHLLPAMQTAPIAPDSSVDLKNGELETTLSRLALPTLEGEPTSPRVEQMSGRTFLFDPENEHSIENNRDGDKEKIEALTLTFQDNSATLSLRDAHGEYKTACGIGDWIEGESHMIDYFVPPGARDGHVMSRGIWTADDTFAIQFCFYRTPYLLNFICKFDGDNIEVSRKLNVSFGATELPTLVGHLGS